MKALKISGIAILLIAASAYALDGVVLKYTAKKNDVQKTRIKGKIEAQGLEISIEMVNQSTVSDVAADGTITSVEKLVSGKFTLNGTEQEIDNSSSMTTIMKPNGEIKEIKADEVTEIAYRAHNLMSFIAPSEEVKVGSSWDVDHAANKDTKAPAFKTKGKIVGEETIGGSETFKIEFKNIETEGTDPSSIEGTIWVDKSNCELVKSTQKWGNVTMPGSPFPVSGSFTMERIK